MPAKRSRAKRNPRKPPEGWEVYCQWYAAAPEEFAERTGVHVAGDGEAHMTREDAVLAAWSEVEQDEFDQATTRVDR